MIDNSLKGKTAKGLFFGGISNGLQQGISAVIGIIFLKHLTSDDYGMMGLLAIFLAIASTIQESGFTAALVNRQTFKSDDYNSVFWTTFFISSLVYLVLFFCAPYIALFYNQPDLVSLSRILFLNLPIAILGIAPNALLLRRFMVKERAIIDIISMSVSGIIGVLFAVKGQGYWALVSQMLSFSFIKTILLWIFSPWHPSFSFHIAPAKEMFGFSSKLLFSNIISIIQSNIFSILLGKFSTKSDVGIYYQGTKWAGMGSNVISGMVNSVAQPMFVEARNDTKRQLQVFRKIIRFAAFISFPFLLGVAFIGKEFIVIINDKWLPCVPILQLYCIWNAFAVFQLIYEQLIVSHGKSSFFFWCSISFAVIQIGVAILSLPYGLYWMAFFAVLVSFVFLFVRHTYASRLIRIRLLDILKDVLPYLFITLLTFTIVYLITRSIDNVWWRFISKIILSIAIYCFIMWKSNSVIFRESIQLIFKRQMKI